MHLKNVFFLFSFLFLLHSCKGQNTELLELTDGVDTSAGGVSVYIINTPSAIYHLEKKGGGLSSMIDKDGVDWIGFNNVKGSGWKGEYRGFPNAIHHQDGDYFHAMNAGTDSSISEVKIETDEHVRIVFTSDNKQWQGQWDFYLDRCDFTMSKVSSGYNYWIQYEGVPGGEMDSTDFWYASVDTKKHEINEAFVGDLPSPEWMAFGDEKSSRMIYMLHHQDDELPDNYVSRPYMTVFGFGRENKEKFLNTIQTFSIGFVESKEYSVVNETINKLVK